MKPRRRANRSRQADTRWAKRVGCTMARYEADAGRIEHAREARAQRDLAQANGRFVSGSPARHAGRQTSTRQVSTHYRGPGKVTPTPADSRETFPSLTGSGASRRSKIGGYKSCLGCAPHARDRPPFRTRTRAATQHLPGGGNPDLNAAVGPKEILPIRRYEPPPSNIVPAAVDRAAYPNWGNLAPLQVVWPARSSWCCFRTRTRM